MHYVQFSKMIENAMLNIWKPHEKKIMVCAMKLLNWVFDYVVCFMVVSRLFGSDDFINHFS